MLPIILVAPHAHSTINNGFRKCIALTDYEIWKCSDPYTGQLSEFNCAAFKHAARVHRLVCDLNRAPNIENAFREVDFFGRKIFNKGKEFTDTEKQGLLMKYWHPFHQEIIENIYKLDDGENEIILLIDYHNTSGDHALNQDREYMPSMIFSNLGVEVTGKKDTSHPVLSIPHKYVEHLAHSVSQNLGVGVEINTVFHGGYNLFWYAHLRNILKTKAKIYAIQIEYNLDLIFNPISKSTDKKALNMMQKALNKGIISMYEELLANVSKK